jgi:hypothetical protein
VHRSKARLPCVAQQQGPFDAHGQAVQGGRQTSRSESDFRNKKELSARSLQRRKALCLREGNRHSGQKQGDAGAAWQ